MGEAIGCNGEYQQQDADIIQLVQKKDDCVWWPGIVG